MSDEQVEKGQQWSRNGDARVEVVEVREPRGFPYVEWRDVRDPATYGAMPRHEFLRLHRRLYTGPCLP